MKKFTAICMAAFAALLSFMACNSSDNHYPEYEWPSDVAVYSFAFASDDSVLANLDTVYFSIDLENARIFNGDSLPYGTDVTHLVPRIRLLETVSELTLTVHRADGTDTVFNYLENDADSVDFSAPVDLYVKSANGLRDRTYEVKVNVHRLVPDSLVWDQAAMRALPTNLAAVKEQKTVRTASTLHCLTTDGAGNYCIATTSDPFAGEWEYTTPAFVSAPDVNTFAATDNALFILSADGALCTSANGSSWTATGKTWKHIYGSVENTLVGCRLDGAQWVYASYPATASDGTPLPETMPVSGTSQLLDYTFPYAMSKQAVMVGGELASGKLTGAVWAFDGSDWAMLNGNFGLKLRNATIVPFFVYHVNNVFVASEESVVMLMGGEGEEALNDSVYVSPNFGMTWRTAGQLMQLPDYIAPFAGAQAFVESTTLGSRSAGGWLDMPFAYRLPATAQIWRQSVTLSRATVPVTTWDCPFIYVFGGNNSQGELRNELWRVTLNRLTFKPIL